MRNHLVTRCLLLMPASFFLVAGNAPAQVVFNKKTITSEAAEKIANTCMEWFKSHNVRGKPAVWVLNANGDIIYMKRVDGANKVGVETGRMKAQSALYLFRPTKSIGDFTKTPSGGQNLAGVASLIQLNGYSSAGGLPILVDGEVVGAVGVGGMAPNQAEGVFPDEQCAQAGIDAVFKK